MKKLIFIALFLMSLVGWSQEYIPINTGYGFEQTTTSDLNALTKKAEGDIFFNYTTKTHIYWDGTNFANFSSKSFIDLLSPISDFDFALGTYSELNSESFLGNTILIPTDAYPGDVVTTDAYLTGLTLGLSGSDLTLTATRNGLSNVVSNTIELPESGGSGDMTKAEYDTDDDGTVDDSEGLSGISSSQFIRSDVSDIKTSGALKFNDNVELQFGTGTFARMFGNGSNTLLNLGNGNFIIQDGGVNKITFNRTDGNIVTGGYVSVGDEAYNSISWNGSPQVPTKNAIRDVIETLGSTEKDTFTPVLEAGSSTPYTYDVDAYYIKDGDLVYVWIQFTNINGSAASGNLEVTGLPYNANVSAFSSEQQMFPYFISGTSSAAITNPIGEVSSNTLRLRNQDGVTNSGNAGVDFGGSGNIIINMTYIAQ
tara:strand:+ start:2719 stop:3993 length:1275 start_codon:yes stop_codon:yes gene_type:complete